MLGRRLVLIPVLALLALTSALACGGDDDEGPTPTPPAATGGVTESTATPTATLGIAPEATQTPASLGSPEEQARGLTLLEAPAGMLQFTADGPYVVPGDALGVFYLDIDTQRIEGWYDLLDGTRPAAFSSENRFTLFQRAEQVFRGGVTYPAGLYLGDRETRKLYRWDGEATPVYQKSENGGFEIASRGDRILFRVAVESGEDWFALVNVASGEVESAFQADIGIALLSEDGERIAFAAWTDTGTAWSVEVGVLDAVSGDELFREGLPFDELDLEGTVELIESRDGESFTLVANPVKTRFSGIASRFSWDGNRQMEVTGRRVFISPFGEHVAIMEPLLPSQAEETTLWNVYSAIDMGDGSEMFRITGATRSLGRSNGNRWLADGSGFLVGEPPDDSLVLAMQDGRLVPSPGIPSPDSAERFMRPVESGVGVFDASGTQLMQINFQSGINDSTNPWGNTSDEVRIVLQRPGRGGPGLTASITGLRVELPPYDAEPKLQINDVAVAFGLLDLYSEPGGPTVTGRVDAPYRVAVEEVRSLCHGSAFSDPERCPHSDSPQAALFMALVLGDQVADNEPLVSTWARVTTPGGQSGWLLMQVTRQGL